MPSSCARGGAWLVVAAVLTFAAQRTSALLPRRDGIIVRRIRTSIFKSEQTFGRRSTALPASGRELPDLVVKGDTLELLPKHVVITAASSLIAVAGVAHTASVLTPAVAFAAIACGLTAAELFSGVFHWATDNYGSVDTPIFGEACAAFQGHHIAPWTITYRHTANNVHKIAKAAAPAIALAAWLCPAPVGLGCAVMLYGQVLAQEAHKWSHVPKLEQPKIVRWLQSNKIALSTSEHGKHHASPYAEHYCILQGGFLNPVLDKSHFFRRLEALVFKLNGVEPNCWKDGDQGAKVKELALAL